LQRRYAAQSVQRIVVAVLELAQAVELSKLEATVRALCESHAYALGVCMTRSTEGLSFRPLTQSDPAPFHPAGDTDAWTLAEELVHVPFEPGAPLFRIACADRGKRLVCAFDHIVFDGISAAQFTCLLARTLDGAPLSAAEPDAQLPLDARLDLRPSAAQLLAAIRAKPALPPLPSSHDHELTLRTRVTRHELGSADTDRLRARAHRAGVSLHAAISSCALLAVAQVLGVQRRRLRLHTPISLRARCRPEPRGFGVFISSVDADLDVTPQSDAWSLAREYAEALAHGKPGAPGRVGLLAFAGDLRERAKREETAQPYGRSSTLEVSNVGRVLDVPPGTAVWLTQGAHYHGPLFVLTLLESAGVLRACLSTPYPLIDNAHTEHFSQAFAQQIAKACSR
jgi:hypothetical protein